MAGTVAAVVVAAGRGLRAGGGVPKQYRPMPGGTAIQRSLATFSGHGEIALVQPVIHPDDQDAVRSACPRAFQLLPPVFGGATRQDSVRAGLEALAARKPDIVLIHDAARPFASSALITRAIAAAAKDGAAVPVLPVADTVKTVDAKGLVTGTLDRALLRAVQTPQAFGFAAIVDAHRRALTGRARRFHRRCRARRMGRDDGCNLRRRSRQREAHHAGGFPARRNREPGRARRRPHRVRHRRSSVRRRRSCLARRRAHPAFARGHRTFRCRRGAARLVDAILGAISDGDIGVHFPPSDPQWRGASSDRFLAFAVERVRARGGLIAHLDITVVCEAPRVGPHRDAMRARIAEIAGISAERVAIKATTSEKMGFTGRGEGIVAFATATVRLPWRD